MDVDSTLINEEVIELLAAHAGSEEMVARVTARAMNGVIDFAESLTQRVATLAGLPDSVFDEVLVSATLTPGAAELVAECHSRGWEVALVSGGFAEVVEPLAESLGIRLVRANHLEVTDGRLTGRTRGPVVDAAAKEVALRDFATDLGIPMSRTIAVGDGANDLKMLDAAAIGVAFCAKPTVAARAAHKVSERDLRDVLRVIDASSFPATKVS